MKYRMPPRGVAAGFGVLAVVSMGALSMYSIHQSVAEVPHSPAGAPVAQSGPVTTTTTTPSVIDNSNNDSSTPPPPPVGAPPLPGPPGGDPNGHPGGPGGPPH